MKLSTLFVGLALMASTILGQGAIEKSLISVNDQTLRLGQAVSAWKGNLIRTLPIIKASTGILESVAKGTKTAKQSEPLDFLGALGVAVATNTLAGSVNSSLSALIQAKPKFDKLLLSPVILINLDLQRKVTTEMSRAIVEKVPAELQGVAEELVRPIDASFELAIDVFHL